MRLRRLMIVGNTRQGVQGIAVWPIDWLCVLFQALDEYPIQEDTL